MTEHLGYEKHDSPEAGTGNVGNGTRAKTVLTDTTGPVEIIDVPRDRAATFEPQIVKKVSGHVGGAAGWRRWSRHRESCLILAVELLPAKGVMGRSSSSRKWSRFITGDNAGNPV